MKLYLLALLLFVSACSVNIHDLPDSEDNFDLFAFFDGKVTAWGMVQDYRGALTRQFTVEIDGVINADKLTLTEDFVFDDGELQQRIWTISKLPGARYKGTAADVVGEAEGIVKGNTLNWQYTLSMDVDGSNYHIHFDDWMYLQDENRLFNRASLSKLGIEVGEVTLFFEKNAKP